MNIFEKLPEIIQGGMGVGVSNWRLAKAVSKQGQLGVVSGTAIDAVFARRLQLGDLDGSIRRALSKFPWQETVRRILDSYFVPDGKSESKPFKGISMPTLQMTRERIELMVVANFTEVFLAKEDHDGVVGINYLEKIQLPTLPSVLGAMLAGVNFVLMGAGIPLAIPGVLDGLSHWKEVELRISVEENTKNLTFTDRFNARDYFPAPYPELTRPKFLAIISSEIIAKTMIRRASGYVDGFIVENFTAGGHNAPPRKVRNAEPGALPQFGEKDVPDLAKIRELERPFWLAGGFASPDQLKSAREEGAVGIQLGTIFAYCNESGIKPDIKEEVLKLANKGELKVLTDFRASPTGYPFKVIKLEDTVMPPDNSANRKRVCDLGYLRSPYSNGDGKLGYRCASEPIQDFIKKGGKEEDTDGRQCLCNGLMATIGLGQQRRTGDELPIVTSGEDFSFVPKITKRASNEYAASDVIEYLMS